MSLAYRTWANMIQRCHNPKNTGFDDYGGRGITVCRRWQKSFVSFLEDMGPKPSAAHSIERKNNNRGYEPGNCRWATRPEQARNKRNNLLITIRGETRCFAEWCEHFGIKQGAAYTRLLLGWDAERAFTQPTRKKRHHAASSS